MVTHWLHIFHTVLLHIVGVGGFRSAVKWIGTSHQVSTTDHRTRIYLLKHFQTENYKHKSLSDFFFPHHHLSTTKHQIICFTTSTLFPDGRISNGKSPATTWTQSVKIRTQWSQTINLSASDLAVRVEERWCEIPRNYFDKTITVSPW